MFVKLENCKRDVAITTLSINFNNIYTNLKNENAQLHSLIEQKGNFHKFNAKYIQLLNTPYDTGI